MSDYSIEVAIPTAAPPGLLSAGTIIEGETATPALRITQTGAGNALVVEDSTHPDSTPLVINNLGQIISGATTAFGENGGLQLTSDSASVPNASLEMRRCDSSAATSAASIRFIRTRNTGAAPQAVASGDVVGNISFVAHDGTALQNTAIIRGYVEGAVSSGNISGGVSIFTRNTTTSAGSSERMRIDNVGNVGIGGTADADAILDLQSTNKGFLPPRMTTTQRNAIAAPIPAGLMVYNTTTNKLNFYNGAAWEAVTSST